MEADAYGDALRYMEYSFIYMALFGDFYQMEYEGYQKILHLGDYGYVLNIELASSQEGVIDDKVLYEYLKTKIGKYRHCVVGPRMGEHILAFVHFETKDTKELPLAAPVAAGIEEKFGFPAFVGIGRVVALADFRISYEEALRSLRYQGRKKVIKNAVRYIEDNYMEQISLEHISSYIGISPQYFSKIFKEETGMNYIDWLTKLRIENAKKIMIEKKSTIKQACYMVGYNDPSYFSRAFKKIVGVSPTVYVNEKRGGEA